ncbi:MAG: hypothetical protein ABSF64_12995 [Bryobacteraceae bacterium]|jgi:DNA-binding ferritin-like protein (Dps family)
MRMNFELPEERVNELKALQAETGSDSMKELFNNALTMLEWAIKEVKHGNEIAAVNGDNVYRVFVTPLLERVAKKHRPETALAHAARS